MQTALIFVVTTLSQLYLFVMLLRLLLPWLRADFRNPISQGILRLTSPLVIPLRRFVPAIGRLDTATIIVAFVLQYLTILIVLIISGAMAGILPIAVTAIFDLVILTCRLFMFAILIHIVLSWIARGSYNDATIFVAMIAEPVLRPFRRLVPGIGGIDISPVFAIILLQVIDIIIRTELRPLPI